MDLRILTFLLVLANISSSEVTPQLCLNGKAGGLGCRCTTSLSDMLLPTCDVNCSARNISVLPNEWNISQIVRSLDLSRNQLTTLANEQFSHWGNLEDLNLSRNRFTSLNQDVFVGLTNLQTLDLSFNELKSLPPTIFNGLPILSNLNLEMNKLQQLPANLFSPTQHLQSLTLSYNLELGSTLFLSEGALIVIFRNNLTSLTMNNMSITSIPKDFFNEAANLRYLSLADNPLKMVDIFPPSLETLNLSGTDISLIFPGDFISYPNLKKLHLDRLLQMTHVERNAFEGLETLEELTMENCILLHDFHEMAFGEEEEIDALISPLRRISFARSGLHTLGPRVFSSLKSTLKEVDLQGNPWDCDCQLSWIKHVNFSLVDRGYLRCFSPEIHHNKLIKQMKEEDFVCKSPEPQKTQSEGRGGLSIALDASLVILVLVVCSAILFALWRRDFLACRRRQTVGTYSHVTIEPNRAELEWDDKDLDHIWTTPPSAK